MSTSNAELDFKYESLKRIHEQAWEKTKNQTPDIETGLWGIATGYAIDFIDVSRDAGKALDITAQTEDHVWPALLHICYANLKAKKTTIENRQDMTKKFGYYQLFCLTNTLNSDNQKLVEIAVQDGARFKDCRLVIQTLPGILHKTLTFDPLMAAKKMIDGLMIGNPDKENGYILMGTMVPFYQSVNKGLLDPLGKVLGDL